MAARRTNGAAPHASLKTHFQVFYVVSFGYGPRDPFRYAIYVETTQHQQGIILQAQALSRGVLSYSTATFPNPNDSIHTVCLQPIGWAAKNSISQIKGICQRIPMGAPDDNREGPPLPGQPPRDKEEWANVAIDALFAHGLFLPLGRLDA
ncbi:hypothetical protein F5144DRAFT_121807 [Chaetomium tenue]|uniref:Uncharacterized protein n=1 Tax=Chaetomium tenue TaxID=1854479 RepID=A0ACB7PJ47_9PEZI|nr:hypothetical protein F5144DRAFT_121807 [Chaetomium globosum]